MSGRLGELMRNTDPDGTTDLEVLDPDQPTEAQAQAAFTVEKRIKDNVLAMRTLWVNIAEDLYRFSELQMWRDLGHTSFEQWLAGPDVDLGRRTVFGLIEVWKEFVINRGVRSHEIADVPISKLRDALPAVRRSLVDVQDAISDCRTLPRDDLRQRYTSLSTPTGSRRESAGTLPATLPLDDTGEPPAGGRSSGIVREDHAGFGPPPSLPSQGGFAAEEEPEYARCPTCGSRYQVKR